MPAPSRKTEVLTPSRLREKRRRARLYRLLALLFLLAVLIGSTIGFFYIPALRVRDVSIEGTQSVSSDAIKEVLFNELSGRKLLVLPANNAFLYDESRLRSAVLRQFPKIKKITITLSNFHYINASVEERSPIGLWCGESKEAMSACMYFDAEGIVYEAAPDYSGDAYIKWYGSILGTTPGGRYAGDSFISLFALVQELEKEKIHAQKVFVEKNGDVEILYSGEFRLLFTLSQKPETILAALHAAKESDVLRGKELTQLSYLDLRFAGNRLYYKMK